MTRQPGRAQGAPLDAIAASLRRERERAGLSLTELARRAGLAKSTLSQLETGTGNPSVETLWALAVALDVPFSRLVEPPPVPVRVVRAGTGPGIPSETGHFVGTLLSSCPPHARRDLYVLSLRAGAPRPAEPHIAGTTEHVVVGAGRLRTGPATDPVELGPGDYAAFPGDAPHTYESLTPECSVVLVMEHT
ncbi:MAG TPA: XRE family transcriptional regulator [Pseudonocardiaceae bacterium]